METAINVISTKLPERRNEISGIGHAYRNDSECANRFACRNDSDGRGQEMKFKKPEGLKHQ